jgi:transcriptional regulator with XRE-family HTH domain
MSVIDDQRRGFDWLSRRYRESAGLTQAELAERPGLTVRAISDMERGRTARPYIRYGVLARW